MYNLRVIKEAVESLKKNKLRSLLTGFGIAWGIFILVILLGLSGGFETGVLRLFNDYSQNSIWVYGGYTNKTKEGYSAGRNITFKEDDLLKFKKYFDEINAASPELGLGSKFVSYNEKVGQFTVSGVWSDYFKIKLLNINKGRLLNNNDYKNRRNFAVIGDRVSKILFPKTEPIGKIIKIGNSFFTVIGTLKTGSIFSKQIDDCIIIPYSTCMSEFNMGLYFMAFGINVKDNIDVKKFEEKFRKTLAFYYRYDEKDENAIYIFNFEEQVKAFKSLFKGLRIFFWFIGLCFLLSGIVSISNIMFVIVKERTREIGIRKAIGAKRKNIMQMIISESLVITIFAGGIGIVLGIGVLALVDTFLPNFVGNDFIIKETIVNFSAIFTAFVLLIIAGVIAGLIPAKKASEINPIEAIRQ